MDTWKDFSDNYWQFGHALLEKFVSSDLRRWQTSCVNQVRICMFLLLHVSYTIRAFKESSAKVSQNISNVYIGNYSWPLELDVRLLKMYILLREKVISSTCIYFISLNIHARQRNAIE